VLATEVEGLAIALRVDGGSFVHGHAADGVLGSRFGCGHGPRLNEEPRRVPWGVYPTGKRSFYDALRCQRQPQA
jgi:hypothetical protein